MAESGRQKASQAREVMDSLYEISKILNTGLDMETLATCVRLCENGVNPEALTMVIQELRRESVVIKSDRIIYMSKLKVTNNYWQRIHRLEAYGKIWHESNHRL